MEERVRAAVRLLPLPPEAFRSLRVEGTDVIIKARHGQDASLTHAMDQVFPEDCSQGDVYDWVAPAVEDVANRLGIKRWTAGASPAQKAARLDALKAEGRKVLMIGDGLNDAGSLALAHASLAPGGAMDVSQSASDAVYTGTGLGAILAIIDTARGARIRMLQNFSLAALYNMVAVPIAVAGFATPLVAAIAMSASSVIVTLNAIRPTRSKEPIS